MNKLNVLEGKLTLFGRVAKAKPIGKPIILWSFKEGPKVNEMELDFIMRDYAKCARINDNEIPDAYLEGEILEENNRVYIPIQFYKLEP